MQDFWWPPPPPPPPSTDISSPNYGFVMFQQYFNNSIDKSQVTSLIIVATALIVFTVIYFVCRLVKKSSKIKIESKKETELLKANQITCNHFNDSSESTLYPKTIYPCLSSCTDHPKSVQFMVPPYSTFAQNTIKGEFNHQNFQSQQIMPPERFSEGKDIENWLLKLTTYLQANPHQNKELTLKCLLDDSVLALVELASTKSKSSK